MKLHLIHLLWRLRSLRGEHFVQETFPSGRCRTRCVYTGCWDTEDTSFTTENTGFRFWRKLNCFSDSPKLCFKWWLVCFSCWNLLKKCWELSVDVCCSSKWKLCARENGTEAPLPALPVWNESAMNFLENAHFMSHIVLRDLSGLWQKCRVFLNNVGHTYKREAAPHHRRDLSFSIFFNLAHPLESCRFA